MELFLWFWLLDRRFLCNMRPILKHFSFLWLLPIFSHLSIIILNTFCLFPFKNLDIYEYIIAFITTSEVISCLCLFIMMINLYNISKNQPTKNKNILVVNTNNNKNSFIYYEDYWIGRKNLISVNGIIILLLGVFHIIWSFYYLFHKNIFQNIFQSGEQMVLIYAYLNIIFCIPVIFLLISALIIKVTFLVSAMACTSCVVSLSKTCCCKKNRGLKKIIDFSDIQKLEPEFV